MHQESAEEIEKDNKQTQKEVREKEKNALTTERRE